MAVISGKKIYVRLEPNEPNEPNEFQLNTLGSNPNSDEAGEEQNERLRTLECFEKVKRIWFSPILDLASLRVYPYAKDHLSFKNGCFYSTCSVLFVIGICFCVILQILMLLAFIADMVYRPLLFISIHSNISFFPDNHNSSKLSSIIQVTSSSRLYHMYEDWFLFAWDYLYGIIGLYSTVFLFMNAWNVDENNFPGIIKLINEIVENNVYVHKIKRKKHYSRCEQFQRFLSCSDNKMQSCLTKLGWGISHFLVIILSVVLVIYWIAVNAINWYYNSEPNEFLTQASSISLALMIFDSIHWHLAPVIVCFLVRISCMEITTKLNKIRYQYAKLVIDLDSGAANPNISSFVLWKDYFKLIEKVSAVSKKYRRISAINITVLIFSVVGISVHYFENRIDLIDEFIQYDWIDSIRFLTWYCVHLFSVWAMVNEIATLNLALDHLPDEILVILATNGKIQMNEDIKMQLDLCKNSLKRFSIDFFGVVTPMTVHLIIAFGSATIAIFFTESLKIVIEKIKIKA